MIRRGFIKRGISIVVVLFMFYSCSTKTAHTNYGDVALISAKDIVDSMNVHSQNPEYLSANLKIKYSNKENKLNFNAQLRMKTDSAIWMNITFFGISVARAIVEPEGVKMYERQNKTFFDGDFQYLSKLLGVDLNYDQLQALLLGRSIQNIDGSDYDSQIQKNSFLLEYDKNRKLTRRAVNNGDYIKRYWVNPINFELERQIVALPDRTNTLIIENSDYEFVDKKYKIPAVINLQIVNESVTLLEIEYKGMKTSNVNSFPFRIPSSYKEIKLN